MSCSAERKKRVNWTWAEEKAMLNIFKEKNIHAKLDGRELRSDECYNEVSEEMAMQGYFRTANQIRVKYYALRSMFKDLKRKHGVSGAGSESIPHETILYELFGHRPAARLIDAGVDSGRNPDIYDDESADQNLVSGTVGLGGVVTILNPDDDDPDDPLPLNNSYAAYVGEEPQCQPHARQEPEPEPVQEPDGQRPAAQQEPAYQPLLARRAPERQAHPARQAPECQRPVARQAPECQRLVARQAPECQRPVARQEPVRRLAEPIQQDHDEAGDLAADNRGAARYQVPGPGQQRALHGIRRGGVRPQDRTKGKGSYAKALINFHEQWSLSQRELQEQMVERHETFLRFEVEASRQWEAQQQVLHEQHTTELIESSNAALTTAIDKLLGAFNRPPEQPQVYQPIAYQAGFPQPVHQFTYPVNVPSPTPSPSSIYSTTSQGNCNLSAHTITSPSPSPSPSSVSSYSSHGSQRSSPVVVSIRSPNPRSSFPGNYNLSPHTITSPTSSPSSVSSYSYHSSKITSPVTLLIRSPNPRSSFPGNHNLSPHTITSPSSSPSSVSSYSYHSSKITSPVTLLIRSPNPRPSFNLSPPLASNPSTSSK